MELDAFTFAEWNVDFVKLDGCYSLPRDMDQGTCNNNDPVPRPNARPNTLSIFPFAGYSEFGYHLNKTGKPMVYSCSWPVYQTYAGLKVSGNRRGVYAMASSSRNLFSCVLLLLLYCH